MTFHVGNLSSKATQGELLEAFRTHGKVESVILPAERMRGGAPSGPHRGYAFVVMRNKVEAAAALKAVDGRALHGQAMAVRVALPRWTPSYVS